MAITFNSIISSKRGAIKRTRQGTGKGTKLGHKKSKRHYIKKYRGQGGPKRRKA
tara:strand:+ start:100 stop:261 length:162 start_codon:yes stop_codon:yes gene_type:complete